jgi:iron complex transport system substrate-binding protein
MNRLFISFLLVFVMACSSSTKESTLTSTSQQEEYASFSIKDSSGFKIIEIKQPFLGALQPERYVLYLKQDGQPEGISASVFVGLPVERIGINSTTHLGFLNAIEQSGKIVAATNNHLFYDGIMNQRIDSGKVTSLGNRVLNTEKTIKSELDVLFSFAIDAASYEEVKKLRKLGQPVIVISEFLEADPIRKARWLDVFAAFFDTQIQEKSKQFLEEVELCYDSIRNKASLFSFSPSVSIGLPWKGTWYVSGAESYQAQLIKDAGGLYTWKKYKQAGSVPLDIETAISQGLQSDIWINPGMVRGSKELLGKNEIFEQFKSYKNRTIYTNYKLSNSNGANDYWEKGAVRPDLILADLVAIFHPLDSSSVGEATFYKSIFK